jgi:hypothetical protein
MNELEPHLSTDSPVRQGDIFAWSNWTERGDWEKFGIIVTADCDIAHERSSTFFTYLPILPLKSYIQQVWVKERLTKLANSHQRLITDEIHRYHLRINPSALQLQAAALHRWVTESSDDHIIAELRISEHKEANNLRRLLSTYRLLVNIGTEKDPTRLVSAYCEARAQKQAVHVEKAAESIARDAQSDVVRNLPFECFFLSSLPQIPDLGFIVMLRYIQPIQQAALTTSFELAKTDPGRAYRLGRLSPTFKYALTQRFANLFVRIGLPVEYEEWREAVVEDACGEIVRSSIGGQP